MKKKKPVIATDDLYKLLIDCTEDIVKDFIFTDRQVDIKGIYAPVIDPIMHHTNITDSNAIPTDWTSHATTIPIIPAANPDDATHIRLGTYLGVPPEYILKAERQLAKLGTRVVYYASKIDKETRILTEQFIDDLDLLKHEEKPVEDKWAGRDIKDIEEYLGEAIVDYDIVTGDSAIVKTARGRTIIVSCEEMDLERQLARGEYNGVRAS